jgi:D-glycerate 3-kinase
MPSGCDGAAARRLRYRAAMTAHTSPSQPAGYAPEFVASILDDALSHDCRIYGIAGLQGSGKSTLAAQVAALAKSHGRRIASLSIDDFYLDHDARATRAREVQPLLATRGPPGTHDLTLACDTLDALRAGKDIALPRFDKIADRRLPRDDWPQVEAAQPGVTFVIFEGWFLKTPPQDETELLSPINVLERDEDPDGTWRRWCNTALSRDYPPLWQRIDRLLFLQPPDFDVVPGWRWQQECALQAANPQRTAMTRAQVDRFVQFFERVSRQALRTLPAIAERTVQLDAERNPMDFPSPRATRGRRPKPPSSG